VFLTNAIRSSDDLRSAVAADLSLDLTVVEGYGDWAPFPDFITYWRDVSSQITASRRSTVISCGTRFAALGVRCWKAHLTDIRWLIENLGVGVLFEWFPILTLINAWYSPIADQWLNATVWGARPNGNRGRRSRKRGHGFCCGVVTQSNPTVDRGPPAHAGRPTGLMMAHTWIRREDVFSGLKRLQLGCPGEYRFREVFYHG
jgi:hypothetical protein